MWKAEFIFAQKRKVQDDLETFNNIMFSSHGPRQGLGMFL
jgi:hypothetical protein